ncbi:MAG TPA: MFS transporter [Tepidisphaeraceae bacterium]|nr:MFS transporter [Tepidisphaeraceae bacterium]
MAQELSYRSPDDSAHLYHVGTLTYTKAALAVLFFWLIWGDVCYTLMESVTGPIMLLKFQALHASNTEMALLVSTIPTCVYSFFNPVISFRSDRFRSRFGRRIPFILLSLPFLVLGLIGLAFGDQLGFWIHARLHLSRIPPNQLAMWTLGILLVTFTFFNTFVTTTFWYLFNDVVPEVLLARFMSWFRVFGTLSASLYTFFVFPYSGTHATAIFMGAALLYLVGFGLMCLNVREGQYPPPPPNTGGGTGPISIIRTFGKECHSNRIYWYLWLCTFIGSIGSGVALFDLYFKQAIGLSLFQISDINGTNLIVVSVLIVGAGWLADRYHPIRVVLLSQVLSWVLLTPATMIWIFWHPSPTEQWTFRLSFLHHLPYVHALSVLHIQKSFLISLVIYVGLTAPLNSLGAMWDPVLLMRTFPRSRLGQFCSINAVWRSVGGMLGGFLAGGYLDIVSHRVGKEHAYFYCPIWSVCFGIPAFIFFVKFYQAWKRHGGDDYVAPLPVAVPNPAFPVTLLNEAEAEVAP